MPNIRFVGGPWHNRVEFIELTPKVIVRRPGAIHCGIVTLYKQDLYHLAEFHSGFGTLYYQYVHSKLVKDGYAHECCFKERLAKWRLDRRQLEKRLRRICCETVGVARPGGGAVPYQDGQ